MTSAKNKGRRPLPSDARLAAAGRRNKDGTIPLDILLPLLLAYHHAAAPAEGTFILRGALILKRRRQSRVSASYTLNPLTFSDELSGLANLRPNFPSTMSPLPPQTDHSGGGDGAPSLQDKRGPISPAPHVSVEPSEPHIPVSC